LDKKEEILRATFSHFAKRGYSLTMSDIASSVDIKTPSIYSHFKGKDEILIVTIEREIARYHAFLDSLYLTMTFDNLKEDLYALFKKILGYFSEKDLIRFWRNLLLVDQEELRRTCSQQVFNLEIYHVEKLKKVFEPYSDGNLDVMEGRSLHFLAIIQAALEIELLFYDAEATAEAYIEKMWQAYSACNF